jgi:hypothetical protein
VLAEHFPETAETEPELLAQHYTEAGLSDQAVTYWQRAGQRALERSANVEAIAHVTKGLDVLACLPKTLTRTEQELTLHLIPGTALQTTKGYAAPEVEQVYTRALELAQKDRRKKAYHRSRRASLPSEPPAPRTGAIIGWRSSPRPLTKRARSTGADISCGNADARGEEEGMLFRSGTPSPQR